jgi:hypothetical protein
LGCPLDQKVAASRSTMAPASAPFRLAVTVSVPGSSSRNIQKQVQDDGAAREPHPDPP